MPHWEVDTEIETENMSKNTLNVNVISIVIGALIVLTLLAWITAIKASCEHVMDDKREDRYDCLYEKYLTALTVTVLNTFIIIALYVYIKNKK